MRRRVSILIALGTAAACFGGRAAAQTTSDVLGRVTDSVGAPLPGVAIEATSSSLPGARVAVTDRNGLYRVPSVPPGIYRVVARMSGFRSVEKVCTVALGDAMTVNLTLRIEAEEKVLVSGATPPIDTTSTTTGTNYTSGVISRLPVSRNYADIVRANPGVSTDRGDTEGRFLALAIYGATSAENQWVVDGVNTTNVYKGIQGKAINNEFVQEVEVKTGGYQAEYGRALGGVINVITKSGGNAFHGGTFLYYDSTDTGAEQQVEPEDAGFSMRTRDAERFDYGADLGGFLVKDRLWFFAAYNRVTFDGDVSRVRDSRHVSVDDRFPFEAVEDLYSGKLTWNATPSTTAVGTVFSDRSATSGAAGADPRQGGRVQVGSIVSPVRSTWYSTRSQGGADYGLRLTELFGSRALATIQGAYHRDQNRLTAADEIRYVDQTCAGGIPELACAFPPEANAIWGGYGALGLTGASSRQQYSASVNLFPGNHELKVGGDYMDGRTNNTQAHTGGQLVFLRNEYGQSYYFHRYFAVSPSDPTPVGSGGIRRRARVIDYGGYLQDSWKVSQGVTVNAGLRWDGETTRNYRGDTVLQFDDGWQPRLGLAWDPWRDGKTRVHAFAGRFAYGLPTIAAAVAFGSLTSYGVFNFDPVSVAQDPNVYRHARRTGGGGEFGSAVDEGVEGAYQDELTLGIERILLVNVTAGLKGTYRDLGRALEDRSDLDYNNPETGGFEHAFINPGSNGRFATGNVPTCDRLYDAPSGQQCFLTGAATPEAKRVYRGIELFARHSARDRLWLQASYVYSSLRGNYDGGVNQVFETTAPGLGYEFTTEDLSHNASGILTLDRPHRFRFDGYWLTPLRLAVGLNAFAESGAPLNRLGYHYWTGPAVFLVQRGSAGRLPPLWDANLTVSYPIVVGPVTATLQGYLYNVFNNQIVTAQDQAWTTSPNPGYPENLHDPDQPQNNPYYGRVTARSGPRSFRAALRVSF